MDFNENYYRKVISEFNYNPLDFAPMDFEFHSIPREVMRTKWLCHSGIDTITSNSDSLIVTTGVGLSGIPHMGTLSQILRAIFLQHNGIIVQMVLGDLDSYNARGKELGFVSELSKRYREFILELGFNTDSGIIRDQLSSPELNQRAYLYSKYLTDEDFYATEEDLSELYIKKNIYPGITFPVKQAILLMITDFISLSDKYNNIIIMLGLEEHKYVLLARNLAERMGVQSKFYSMYSRIIRGLNGYPKMSKSIKESSVSVDMSAGEIRSKIVYENDDYDTPENSVIFQMMSSVSDYSVSEISDIYSACSKKGTRWKEYKLNYADRLVTICDKWHKYG